MITAARAKFLFWRNLGWCLVNSIIVAIDIVLGNAVMGIVLALATLILFVVNIAFARRFHQLRKADEFLAKGKS